MLLFDKVLQKYYRSSHTSPVCLVMYPSLNLSAEFARLVELIRRRHLSPPVTPGIPSQPSPLCTSWLYCPAFQVQRLSLDYVVHVCGSSATFPRDGARETDLSWWGQVLLGSKANQNLSKNVWNYVSSILKAKDHWLTVLERSALIGTFKCFCNIVYPVSYIFIFWSLASQPV